MHLAYALLAYTDNPLVLVGLNELNVYFFKYRLLQDVDNNIHPIEVQKKCMYIYACAGILMKLYVKCLY